ncbi:MAG: transposase [Nostoc sp. SerVER01]|uniref:helix-turn-helix domain-containing protein n=1 Tax=Nostoc sp. CCY 9925 TaxID=3103865 RepID=UPI002ADA09E9|nr:helix-turn-helix domain-containing protein [Nostoc sp. SerVER01]MDZ8024884.1 helix-turn-helix domain-containing protein [Nostoc sp. DedQUE11]MDZ8075498.1 helix-turn-helix domain-containing protein [Nostoc sp. DedQUE01]MDZ8079747.1 helix-turn-helix domain-containing protein [Nostoc sp. DcaGUA01]MDZ8238162.1 helix-turn-helix domain-containing protein [Nostoc sp. ChiQUE01a]
MSEYSGQDKAIESYDMHESKFLTPFQRKALLKNLQANLQAEYRRRIEIMLLADMGKSQSQICEILGCSQEMARYWIGIAEAGMAHKWNERPIGRPKTVNDRYIERLKELVNNSPREYGYAFSYWTAQWLSKHLANEFGIQITDRHINRLLKQMGLSTKRKNNQPQETDQNKDAGITISDLQSNSEASMHWSFNLIQSNN